MKNRQKSKWPALTAGIALLGGLGLLAQQQEELPEHADCANFNKPRRKAWTPLSGERPPAETILSELTTKVAALVQAPAGEKAVTADFSTMPTIDRYLFQAMSDAKVTPVAVTNDYEFIRRVTLDLTGRVPTPERVQIFVADAAADKRARLIDELLGKTEWVDKWTMYFGDLYKNASLTSQVRRFPEGVKAFNEWVRASLSANKPYSQMTRELITASGDNSHTKGELNFVVGGLVTGGPVQDIWDQQAADIATTFLGLGHMNCLLCHNGRGHLDTLSLWGGATTRMQAWQFASFLSHTETRRTTVTPPNDYYWGLFDDTRYRTDYTLNTTTGNRPARQPIGSARTVAPLYPFTEKGPAQGENYRVALARELTADFQFARASVNYFWKEFFGVGLVEPVDQFDPARLDPDKPPPAPWTLQPSNARLLNALAQDFINSGYNLKALMKQITTSQAYQLTSRNDGQWNQDWDQYFARKFVRRLWAEEVHDAIAQTSGILPSYPVQLQGNLSWAMQFPEPSRTPSLRNPITSFLDAFLRGNREDEDRRPDGSISQALNLMNDDFVMSRVRSSASNGLLARNLSRTDDELINTLFLTVLSRLPTSQERSQAQSALRTGNRTQEAEHLLWSLYNKVDFVFNY